MKPPTKENPAGGGQGGKKPLEDLPWIFLSVSKQFNVKC